MKNVIKAILYLAITLAMAFLISWLLDWDFIQRYWSRKALIHLVIMLVLSLGFLSIRTIFKKK